MTYADPRSLTFTTPTFATLTTAFRRIAPNQREGFRQMAVFTAIGATSTTAFLLLYILAQPVLGTQPANFLAFIITAIANSAANRRFTFASTSRQTMLRDHAAGLGLMLVGLAIASGSLALLDAVAPGASQVVEISVLVLANMIGALVRFAALKVVTAQ